MENCFRFGTVKNVKIYIHNLKEIWILYYSEILKDINKFISLKFLLSKKFINLYFNKS